MHEILQYNKWCQPLKVFHSIKSIKIIIIWTKSNLTKAWKDFEKRLPPVGKFKFIKIAKMVIILLHTFFKTSRAFVYIVLILTWAI